MKRTNASRKGFTIIEVVLVLAVAGLIFLMVFIALPALQRSQRNTRRRQDMARILSAFDDYAANNNGRMPGRSYDDDKKAEEATELANFVNRYVVGQKDYVNASNVMWDIADSKSLECGNSDQFCDPDGTRYYFGHRTIKPYSSCTNKEPAGCKLSNNDQHVIYYFRYAQCSDEEGYAKDGTGFADIAIMYILEGGAIYCGDTR
jgi:prepilin-type N-terminal cleavage/methylation domain-containing protein